MRDQFKAYISQYSTFIVNKKSDSLKKFLIDHQNSDYFNYYEIVKKWESCGWEIDLGFYSSNTIIEFANRITKLTGQNLQLTKYDVGENASLNYSELLFLRYFNKFPFLHKTVFRYLKYAGFKIARNITYKPNFFHKYNSIEKEISDYYKMGNSILAKRFFDRDHLFNDS